MINNRFRLSLYLARKVGPGHNNDASCEIIIHVICAHYFRFKFKPITGSFPGLALVCIDCLAFWKCGCINKQPEGTPYLPGIPFGDIPADDPFFHN